MTDDNKGALTLWVGLCVVVDNDDRRVIDVINRAVEHVVALFGIGVSWPLLPKHQSPAATRQANIR